MNQQVELHNSRATSYFASDRAPSGRGSTAAPAPSLNRDPEAAAAELERSYVDPIDGALYCDARALFLASLAR